MQYARVSVYGADDTDALVAGFESVTAELKQVDGFSHAYFMVNPNNRRGISITFWDDEDALRESSSRADELRQRGAGHASASVVSVDTFEVRLTA
jgi:heme-degrading monooxygenase HmoA